MSEEAFKVNARQGDQFGHKTSSLLMDHSAAPHARVNLDVHGARHPPLAGDA